VVEEFWLEVRGVEHLTPCLTGFALLVLREW
jgi:hypothetical protein